MSNLSLSAAKFRAFETRDAMCLTLAESIVERLGSAVEERGKASMLVSGGSTPKPLFELLAQQELPWEAITISLSDERWVSPTSSHSNEYLVSQNLLKGNAAKANFLSLYAEIDTPYAAEKTIEQRLQALPMPIDVVLLGMGDDGHTASLFPDAKELTEGLALNNDKTCMALTPAELPEHAPYPRMTFTLSGLLNSAWIALMIAGDSKREVYQQAIKNHDFNSMPVSAILQQQQVPVTTFWAP